MKKLTDSKKKYEDNKEVITVLEEEEIEIELYRKYLDYYGYVAYIM